MKREIKTEDAPRAIGPYSQGIIYKDMVFVSGQIPVVPETGETIKGDIEKAARQVFKNISEILKAAGTGIENVLMTTIYLTDLKDFSAVNTVYQEIFKEPYPARVTVGVKELPKGVDIEVSVIAHI